MKSNNINEVLCGFSCSTTGEDVINKMALENRQAGRDREEIKLADLQKAIAQTVYNSNTSQCNTSYSVVHSVYVHSQSILELCYLHVMY